MRGLDEIARLGAQVTIFRLGDDPGLARFIDQAARRVGAGWWCQTWMVWVRQWWAITSRPAAAEGRPTARQLKYVCWEVWPRQPYVSSFRGLLRGLWQTFCR